MQGLGFICGHKVDWNVKSQTSQPCKYLGYKGFVINSARTSIFLFYSTQLLDSI